MKPLLDLIQGSATARSKSRKRTVLVVNPDGKTEVITFLGHGTHIESGRFGAPPKPPAETDTRKRAKAAPRKPADAGLAELLTTYDTLSPPQRTALLELMVAMAKLQMR